MFKRPEVPLMSAYKLFVDAFISFQKREVIIILICNENRVVLDLYIIILGRTKRKK